MKHRPKPNIVPPLPEHSTTAAKHVHVASASRTEMFVFLHSRYLRLTPDEADRLGNELKSHAARCRAARTLAAWPNEPEVRS